jgi:hypothetical protein
MRLDGVWRFPGKVGLDVSDDEASSWYFAYPLSF